MVDWFQQSFQENTLLWLLLSSVVGGVVGASVRFLFDVMLPQRLHQRREVLAAKRKYATPLLLAADELRRRLGNMIKYIKQIEAENWLPADLPSRYYFLSTLYVVGQFFGWRQILRRTVVYLDFASVKESRQFEKFLRAVDDSFTSPGLFDRSATGAPDRSADRWVVSFGLQAIGDLMILREEQEMRTLEYVTFDQRFNQPDNAEFRKWFVPLERMFAGLRAKDDPRFQRIVAAYSFLDAFVNFNDPHHLRTKQRPNYLDQLDEAEARIVTERIEKILADQPDV